MTMILRGRKLQEALQLVAKGQLSDLQIAERLEVSPRCLDATRELPMFDQRVAQIQQATKYASVVAIDEPRKHSDDKLADIAIHAKIRASQSLRT